MVSLEFTTRGVGEPLVMLHPGGADARAFSAIAGQFDGSFTLWLPDRRGHGRTPDLEGPFTFEVMADDTAAFIEQHVKPPVHVLGYSDGATVALMLALRHPKLVKRLVFVSGVFHREGWEPGVLEEANAPPEFMADSYGAVSPDGRAHYAVVTKKLAALHATAPSLTVEALAKVACPTLVMLGDDDEVRLEHAIELFRSVKDGQLAVVPHASHGVLVEQPAQCAQMIRTFCTGAENPTIAPRRRA